MKVSTWNVNGIRAREAQALEWTERESPDILCLQEIKATPDQIPARLCEMEGYWCFWHGYKAYSGVGLHLRKSSFPERPDYFHPPFDHESRFVGARIGRLVIASVYVPNGGKDFAAKVAFLEALEGYAAECRAQGIDLLICGDLNVARTPKDVHPKLRKETEIGQTPAEQAMLERILAHGLVDVGRKLDPDNDRLFTWWAPWRNLRERNIGWRLDYILASEALAARAVSAQVFREFGTSDHGPVNAVFGNPTAR
ncbi:MAG: exodeoxyribonuclease III [Candidatus Eisenbacteria bacterium]|nr:exodeoxyribonuclease III [Candidatus Eisenbacteria bacterium]